VHVADHALARRDRRGHLMPQRMPGLAFPDSRVNANAGAAVAVGSIGACRLHVAVVGIDDMARSTARVAIVAGIVIGAEKPGRRVVEARFGDVQDRDCDPQPGTRAAVGLADVGASRLLEPLQLTRRVRVADLGELGDDVATAALEDTEDVTRRKDFPRWQRRELGHNPVAPRHLRGRHHRRQQFCRLPVACVGFADDRVLERKNAVIIGAGGPEHGGRRHQATLGRHDDAQVTGTAGFAGDTVIARVEEADKLRRLAVQQGVGAGRLDTGGIVPFLGIAGVDMRRVESAAIFGARRQRDRSAEHAGIPSVAIGAAKCDPRARVHRQGIGRRMAAHAAGAL